ncbi:ABC transporter substrate-binding protein [Bacillaceae bacterium SAOS 7]|nr:ABC transporter substrate-binding protein [Bacillaceae bacterium SAOS 7]
MKWVKWPIVSMLLLILLVGCNQQQEETKGNKQTKDTTNKELGKVTLMLDWFPNTNHTGFYVAKENGFYEEQGLDVEIVQPGEGSTADQLVASGKADFGVSYQEGVTYARVSDIPLVSIGAVIQHNTSALASLKEANISTPKDFEGKRYGGWGAPIEEAVIKAVMKKNDADYNKVENITLGQTDFFTSIGKDADFEWVYYGWDGIEAERRNMDVNYMMLKDLDPALDYYTPVIVTNEKHIAEQNEMVKKFMAATTKGYEFAIESPEEAADILLKHAPELNADLVKASQKWVSEQYQADATQWGVQKADVWQRFADWMYEQKLIDKELKTEDAFTNEFLPKK